jgi:hypothetical protein
MPQKKSKIEINSIAKVSTNHTLFLFLVYSTEARDS